MTAYVNKQFVSISEAELYTLDDAEDSTSTKWIINRSVKLFLDIFGGRKRRLGVKGYELK